MNSEVTKRWIEAGKMLAENPNFQVLCPVCQKGILEIKDVTNKSNPNELERYMTCHVCGAQNSLRLVRPSQKTTGNTT